MLAPESPLETLLDFLSMPLGSADAVFERFNRLPNRWKMLRGSSPGRFLYLPGSRSRGRVLLLAHADTYWDGNRCRPHEVVHHNGLVQSVGSAAGLGADDRAGCAIVWLLRTTGHSILITDGEEQHRRGSRFLKENFPSVMDEIQNDHQFAVQFDLADTGCFKCYDVGSSAFKQYVSAETGFVPLENSSYTDIVTLCTVLAGVNLSVGYHNQHTADEYLDLDQWLTTLQTAGAWLSQDELPRYLQ